MHMPGCSCDPWLLFNSLGAAYRLPAVWAEATLCKGNVAPRTFMRAPGDFQVRRMAAARPKQALRRRRQSS